MPEPALCCRSCDDYCERCDLLVGREGLHVICVERDDASSAVTITVESEAGVMGCHVWGRCSRAWLHRGEAR